MFEGMVHGIYRLVVKTTIYSGNNCKIIAYYTCIDVRLLWQQMYLGQKCIILAEMEKRWSRDEEERGWLKLRERDVNLSKSIFLYR